MSNPFDSKRKLSMASGFTIYIDDNNEWRWRIVAKNNKIIGSSSEGFFGAIISFGLFFF
jgi:hypothetical protein